MGNEASQQSTATNITTCRNTISYSHRNIIHDLAQASQSRLIMSQIFAACVVVFVTALLGELASVVVMIELYDGIATAWSDMPPDQKFVAVGFPCIAAAFGVAMILSGSLKKQKLAAMGAAASAPGREVVIGKIHEGRMCEVRLINPTTELPQRETQTEEDLEAQVLQAQAPKMDRFSRPGPTTPLPSYTAADTEDPAVPPPVYSSHAR